MAKLGLADMGVIENTVWLLDIGRRGQVKRNEGGDVIDNHAFPW